MKIEYEKNKEGENNCTKYDFNTFFFSKVFKKLIKIFL